MNAQVAVDTDEESIERKNALIGEQLISLIQAIHSQMRPFVLIFPALEGEVRTNAQALTNISSVPYLRDVLREHLKATRSVKEFEHVPKASMN